MAVNFDAEIAVMNDAATAEQGVTVALGTVVSLIGDLKAQLEANGVDPASLQLLTDAGTALSDATAAMAAAVANVPTA